MGCVWFFHFTFRKAEHIVLKAYRIRRIYRAEGISCAEGTKSCIRNTVFFVRALSKSPLPLAGGVGVGSQHLHEGVCTQTKPRAKYNKMRKIRRGGFFP